MSRLKLTSKICLDTQESEEAKSSSRALCNETQYAHGKQCEIYLYPDELDVIEHSQIIIREDVVIVSE